MPHVPVCGGGELAGVHGVDFLSRGARAEPTDCRYGTHVRVLEVDVGEESAVVQSRLERLFDSSIELGVTQSEAQINSSSVAIDIHERALKNHNVVETLWKTENNIAVLMKKTGETESESDM